jgi:hypothetical protein
MKFFITYGLEFIFGLTLLTQVLIPIFVKDLKLFWLFKPSKSKNVVTSDLDTLDQEVDKYQNETLPNLNEAEQKVNNIKNKTKQKTN